MENVGRCKRPIVTIQKKKPTNKKCKKCLALLSLLYGEMLSTATVSFLAVKKLRMLKKSETNDHFLFFVVDVSEGKVIN